MGNQLLLMEHGEIAPEQFMTGIKNMLTMMLNGCDAISEEETRRFQTREALEPVRYAAAWYTKARPTSIAATMIVTLLSGKTTAICRAWKKTMDKKMLAELLKKGEKKQEPGGKLTGEVTPLFNGEQVLCHGGKRQSIISGRETFFRSFFPTA